MKRKKNQNVFNMVASVFLGDLRVIWCISKVIVPHQIDMIVCDCI